MASFRSQELTILLKKVNLSSDPEVKLALSRLSREVKEKLATGSPESQGYFVSVSEAVGRLRGSGNSELRIDCLMDCGMYFYVSGSPLLAFDPINRVVALARTTEDPDLVRKGQNLLGIVYADTGNPAKALECHTTAIQIARSNSLLQGEMTSWQNLGVALMYMGRYHDALDCFDRVVSHASEARLSDEFMQKALHNKASCYLGLGAYYAGISAAEESIRRMAEPSNATEAYSRVIREQVFASLLLEVSDFKRASQRCRIAAKYALMSKSLRARAAVMTVQGLLEVIKGDVSQGLDMLHEALDCSQGIASIHHDALIALARAHEVLGHPEAALDYLNKRLQFMRNERERAFLNHIAISRNAGSGLAGPESDLILLEGREAKLRAAVAERELHRSQIEMLERLAVTADLREDASGEHGYRVGKLAALLAEDLGWDREKCHAIELAARLHDIGKIAVPDRILLTSEALKEAERHFMCNHTAIGAELLAKSKIPQLRMAEEIARSHHEWWNGRGYPARLSGKRIPLHARIVAIADVFDALTHGRPYEQAWPMDRALEQVRGLRGLQFDPDLTDRFLDLVDRLRAEHADLDEFLGRAGRNSPFLQAREKIRQLLSEERGRHATVPGNQTRH